MARSAAAQAAIATSSRTFLEAASFLRKVVVTGELAAVAIDLSREVVLRARDNDDRETPLTWERLAAGGAADARREAW
jgi:hypothetical protein